MTSIQKRWVRYFMESKISYFYVLLCKDNSLYGGYTTDLDRRVNQHNAGLGAKYTRLKSKRPVKLLFAQAYPSKSEAMKAEYAFKQLKRPQKETFLVSKGVQMPFDRRRKSIIKEMEAF